MFWKLFLLTAACTFFALHQAEGQEWSHNNVRFWVRDFPMCGGRRQSPINISTKQVRRIKGQLIMLDYNRPFRGPLRMKNNGHTAVIEFGMTTSGRPARIWTEDGIYIAAEMHFHWPGEHTINGRRFAAEVHIVHRNQKYRNTEEAIQREDGLKVLTILLTSSIKKFRNSRDLDPIFNRLPNIVNYNREVTLERGLSLSRFLGKMDTSKYFRYKGSLTTPPCAEAVEFYIFHDTKAISGNRIQRFYMLRDMNNRPLRFTNRPLQRLNNRQILCSKR